MILDNVCVYFQIHGARKHDEIRNARCTSDLAKRWSIQTNGIAGGSESASLAILEYFNLFGIPSYADELLLVSLSIPAESIHRVDATHLMDSWASAEAYTKAVGTSLFSSGVMAIDVPSTIHQFGRNIIVNMNNKKNKSVEINTINRLDLTDRLKREHCGLLTSE